MENTKQANGNDAKKTNKVLIPIKNEQTTKDVVAELHIWIQLRNGALNRSTI